jgi:hypothetical protein
MQMPAFFPAIRQQEWAIGTLSMASAALTNLAFLYPKTREESKGVIATMIERLLRDDLASYETNSWGEDRDIPGKIFIPDNAVTIASLSIAQLTLGIDYQAAI